MKIAEMQLELDVQRRAVDDMQTRQHALQDEKRRLEEIVSNFGDANEVHSSLPLCMQKPCFCPDLQCAAGGGMHGVRLKPFLDKSITPCGVGQRNQLLCSRCLRLCLSDVHACLYQVALAVNAVQRAR